jgi:hypothetical protein
MSSTMHVASTANTGPYCLTCPAPDLVPDDAHVCGPCREAITRGEITADPYYQGKDLL